MLRTALKECLLPSPAPSEPDEGRPAFHSDIRALRPDAWANRTPAARGREIEQAMWLSGVTSRDFDEVIEIALSPDRVTPVDDIVDLCSRKARACRERADDLAVALPPPNPHGRPPLPWHRRSAREAHELYRAADAWDSLARTLLSNHWPR